MQLIQPIGDPDLELINVGRALRGLPASGLELACQHSCSAETIASCQDVNCEASSVLADDDGQELRRMVEQGQLSAFEQLRVTLTFEAAQAASEELQRLLPGAASLTRARPRAAGYQLEGSFLELARLCARRVDPRLSEDARAVLLAMERLLTWKFSLAGPALLRQRFGDLRSQPRQRGNVITLLAGANFPRLALVGWERSPRRKSVPPQASAGFGLYQETGVGVRLGFQQAGLHMVPGELYAPAWRLVFRVDQPVAERVRDHCRSLASQPAAGLEQRMLELLAFVCAALGLEAPVLAPAPGDTQSVFVRPTRFVAQLLLAQPLGIGRG